MDVSLINRLGSYLVRWMGDRIGARKAGNQRLFILTYHRILKTADPMLPSEPDLACFRWQMEALARGFNVIPLSTALAQLRDGNLAPRSVSITFDDGYRSTHDLALPILKELQLSATVFIATSFLDGSNMWNDRIIEALRRMQPGILDLSSAELGIYSVVTQSDRETVADQLVRAVKYLDTQQRLAVTSEIERVAGTEPCEALMLSDVMVNNLANNGFEIGAHTVTHPILTNIDDQQARDELIQCKATLEAITGCAVDLFAYPNGKLGQDYDERHVQMAREIGYKAAFVTVTHSVSKNTDMFQIPRGCPWDKSPLLFQLRLLRWLAQ